MILDKSIEIEVCRANVRFYKDMYKCKVGDVINVKIEHVPTGVVIPILVKCDICDGEKYLSYKKYLQNITRGGYYSCSSKCATDKKKTSYFSKTGFEHPLKNPEVKDRMRNTCIVKYGFDNPNKSQTTKNKSKNTCLLKYGSETYVGSYKFKIDMNDKFGVDNPMHSNEINSKRIKSSFFINDLESIKYQGKYELDFLFYCRDNDIEISKPDFTIEYVEDGKVKKYLPDFFIRGLNLVIEIKSTYYYNLHKEKNILKKEYTIKKGFNYILIMDKDYEQFKQTINEKYDF